jgi:hypothetical protein
MTTFMMMHVVTGVFMNVIRYDVLATGSGVVERERERVRERE